MNIISLFVSNKKVTISVTVVVAILFFVSSFSRSAIAQRNETTFKVIGYFPISLTTQLDTSKVPFSKLTHANLAFVNPDSQGNFNQNYAALKPFIKSAHDHGVKVLYSIGGGSSPKEYHELFKSRTDRQKVIKNLILKAKEYSIDGIDVDLELGYVFGPKSMANSRSFPRENPLIPPADLNYPTFIIELSQAIKAENMLLTVALPGRPDLKVVTKEVLAQFDFVNVMTYDKTMPSRPDRQGNHSTYVDAMDDVDYYRNELMVPKEKIILGVPFYGRGFGPGLEDPVIAYMTYNDIVSEYPGSEWVDHWHFPNGYIMYYNGIPTIKNKAEFARGEAGGIMIWHILQDAVGRKSLLNAIYEVVR